MSLGHDNTDEDVDYVLDTFPKVVAQLRALSPTWSEFEKAIPAPQSSGLDIVYGPLNVLGSSGIRAASR